MTIGLVNGQVLAKREPRTVEAADVAVGAAFDGLMDGPVANAGQCCCGIDRRDPFAEKAVERAGAQRLCDAMDPEATLAPILGHHAVTRPKWGR